MQAYFVSDIHLRSIQEVKARHFVHLLKSIQKIDGATHLFLVGDIFDLWLSDYKFFLDKWEPIIKEVQRIINECDYKAARKVLKVNMNGLQGFLDFRYSYNAARATTCIMQGVKKIGIKVDDMKENWLLGEDAPEWRNHSDDTRKNFVGGWSEEQVLTAEG